MHYKLLFKQFFDKVKPFIKPFCLIMAIYLIASLSLFRANFSYMDDLGRATEGYTWRSDFNRYSSSIFAMLLNTNTVLTDISPLPQIIAFAMIAICGIIITYIYCKRKISYPALIASCFIGLTPFMLGCWAFKFDAPCMALGILASTIPLTLWLWLDQNFSRHKILITISITTLCTFIMWTSYQAASGVLPVIILGATFLDYIRAHRARPILQKSSLYLVGFLLGTIIFRLIFPTASAEAYRGTEMFSLGELLPGIINNTYQMFTTIINSCNWLWALLGVILCLGFCIAIIYASKHSLWHKLTNLSLGITFASISFILSYGAYLILKDAPVYGRSLVGFCTWLAIIAIITLVLAKNHLRFILALPTFYLLYSFLTFSLTFGNALADQERYADFRVTELATELASTEEISIDYTHKIRLQGTIGPSAVMQHVTELYPVVDTIFYEHQNGLNEYSTWGYRKLVRYYDIDMKADYDRTIECDHEVKSSHLYTIYTNSNHDACVTIK